MGGKMNIRSILVVGFALVMLVSCGGNAKVTKGFSNDAASIVKSEKLQLGDVKVSAEDVPDQFVAAMKGFLKVELRKRGLLAGEDNLNPAIVSMDVTYYRMRSGFSRMMFGMLAGKDGVEAKVSIVDSKTKSPLTELVASSYNLAAFGGADDVARMFAEEVAKSIEENLSNK